MNDNQPAQDAPGALPAHIEAKEAPAWEFADADLETPAADDPRWRTTTSGLRYLVIG